MAEASYDVVVTGAVEGPMGELRLAAELARRRGVPGARVAEGLAAGHYLVASRLEHEAATQLASELEGLGARVSLLAAAGSRAVAADSAVADPASSRAKQASSAEARPSSAQPVQCPRHGLLYDPATTSGCRRCQMETSRDQERDKSGPAWSSAKSLSPTKRLFIGLAVSLVLGFVPAALYARGPGLGAVRALREKQETLSRLPASHDTTVAFFQLDDEVARSFRKNALVTLGLWLVLAAGVGAGFARLTASPTRP